MEAYEFLIKPFFEAFENSFKIESTTSNEVGFNLEQLKELGKVTESEIVNDNFITKEIKFESNDGKNTIVRRITLPKGWDDDVKKKTKRTELQNQLNKAVANEDFKKAATIKKQLDSL